MKEKEREKRKIKIEIPWISLQANLKPKIPVANPI
jgi:hypothetical protein